MHRDGHEQEWQRGRMIGDRYQIDRLIGQGGMGVVYSVLDRKLNGIRRALKVVKGAGSGLYTEAATLMRLNHPHLPVIFDYFRLEEQGEEAFVMDFIEGQTLSELLSDPLTTLTFEELVRIGMQLCSALAYLHKQPRPIIHRDLKPSNIMIDYGGNVKVIDFGISRTFKAGQLQDTIQLGTLQFAAPEQLALKQSDERTDIYGLGMLLYYMASGGGIYNTQQGQSIRKLLKGSSSLPFIVILERMLQMNPSYRYASMVEVEHALKSLIDDSRGRTASDSQAGALAGMRQRMLVSIISLHAGAGATFLTPLIAEMLQGLGTTKTVAAIEQPRHEPEWRQSLHEDIRWNATATGIIKDRQSYLHGYEEGRSIHWYAVNHEDEAAIRQGDPSEALEDLLRRSDESITLIDFSSDWEQADSYYWLTKSRYVIVVADPFVAKWQAGKMRKLRILSEELKHKGMELVWIANKDVRFICRQDWLRLFPDRPVATIPLLPYDALLNILWSGKRITDHSSVGKQLKEALKPIIALLANENNAKSH
ncbi:serine/threonine protein kinase [Paenibacillus harenae]|uniref:Serine/threonine-protein kinase n=1 Tax=Paenibacillus harenae TaxID=306543 RepID=A0ABT9TVJ8_PAEHA|nr:serine/threonine-protein kinase [Paenibacillus harenae]MDQ0111363.1 serine/threonine-protein kinase [Paenibacillus harenae]